MNIVADAGNSRIKIGRFVDDQLIGREAIDPGDWPGFTPSLETGTAIDAVLISSVRKEILDLPPWTKEAARLILFDHTTPVPISIAYQSPVSLGTDRIANSVAAAKRYGPAPLVIDCGTCITYTFIRDGVLLGGAISPGIGLRFKALNIFTGNLPLVKKWEMPPSPLGTTTEESIQSGVLHGIMGEINYFIEEWCNKMQCSGVVMTGGHAAFFAPRVKTRIFADPYLTLIGLNDILNFNIEQ